MEEEELLAAELRKIEVRKKERLRKQHDLQKLISQAEHNTERWAGWGVGLSTAFVSSSSLIAESLVLARRALLAPRRPRAWAHPANSGYLSLLPSPHLSPSPPFSFAPPPHTHVQGEATAVFKSYDKSSGVSLRTSKVGMPAGLPCCGNSHSALQFPFTLMPTAVQMKTPMTLGQKKAKAIEQLLEELGTGGEGRVGREGEE